MAATSRHSNSHNHNHYHHQRSLSPSGRFCASSIATSTSFTSSISSKSSSLFDRSSSPTRVNMFQYHPSSPAAASMRFAVDNRSTSPGKSISAVNRSRSPFPTAGKKRTCMCSPTTHPGSFRCSFHKSLEAKRQQEGGGVRMIALPNRLNMRRSAMTNSLVRIGTVEGGEWVKRALATLIRPCAHQQRRRMDFQPRPSRLSIMSQAGDDI